MNNRRNLTHYYSINQNEVHTGQVIQNKSNNSQRDLTSNQFLSNDSFTSDSDSDSETSSDIEAEASQNENLSHNEDRSIINNSENDSTEAFPNRHQVQMKKRNRTEKDIPDNLKLLYGRVNKLIIHRENNPITQFEMHCVEIHKDEHNAKRWKLQCSLCKRDYRPIDYFLFHRGTKCPLFRPSITLPSFSFLPPRPSLRDQLLEQLAIVAASCNISSRQIASPQFKEFLTFLFKNPSLRALPLTYNDKDINTTILKTYSNLKKSSIQKVKDLKLPMFLQIDGGQNGHIHTYQLLLCNPGKIPPFPFKSIETIHWTGEEFVKNVQEIILELLGQNIIISAITGDNLRAQTNALDPKSLVSLQAIEAKKINPNPNLVSLLYFPCLAHTTDLALDDAVDDPRFHTITEAKENLFMFHKFFHDNDVRKIIGRFNLSICEKQWIFLIKPALSLLKNIDKIVQFRIKASQKLKDEYPDVDQPALFNIYRMTNLLLPLYNYVELLEKNDTCLWQVEPAFHSLISELNDRGQFYQLQSEAELLINCLINRNQITAKKELMVAAYYLTPIGFYMIQKWHEEQISEPLYDDIPVVWERTIPDQEEPQIHSHAFLFDEINLPQELDNPDGWDVDLHNSVEIRHSCLFPPEKYPEEEENNDINFLDLIPDNESFINNNPPVNNESSENEISSNNRPLVNNENSSNTEDYENEYESDIELSENASDQNNINSDTLQLLEQQFNQNKEIADDKWNQILSIQTTNIRKIVNMLEEITSIECNDCEVFYDMQQTCQRTFSVFLHHISLYFEFLNQTLANLIDMSAQEGEIQINSNDYDFQGIIGNLSNSIIKEFTSDILRGIFDLILHFASLLNDYENIITSLELQFIKEFNQQNFITLQSFIVDESIVFINQRLERYTNGLLNLKNSICSIINDIIFRNNQMDSSDKYLWQYTTSMVSSSPKIIAHFVVRNLGKMLNFPEDQLLTTFTEWNPGKTNDPIEDEIFKMYKFQPVDYWVEMSKIDNWKNLANIALRIISIPPTEAACERVFSARRDIMTKHISNIRDSVLEARAHLKSGLYHQIKD